MKIYLANIHQWHLPERASQLMMRQGHEVAGNWRESNRQSIEEFRPDIVVYSPHRGDTALRLPPSLVKKTPTILWCLCPDYITGWDRERNVHLGGFLESVRNMLPHFRAILANSFFTKTLLEARVPGYTFEVCYLGIDTIGIDEAIERKPRGERAGGVLWHLRWSSDKNLPAVLDIVRSLARRYPDTAFWLGRQEDWSESFWVPQSLKTYYYSVRDELDALTNIRYSQRFETQEDYWQFISGAEMAFSCAYHESFGIGMLEQAYAGAACVVPNRVVYPEVHSGALVVPPSEVGKGIESLLDDPKLRAQVAESSRANAAKYDIVDTAVSLLNVLRAC